MVLRVRGNTSLLGLATYLSFLASVLVTGGGIWLAKRANTSDCIRVFHWPVVTLGLVLMVIAIAGFIGACSRQAWILRCYFLAIVFVVITLLALALFIFAFAVTTSPSNGQVVTNRQSPEYQLGDYHGWLHNRVSNPSYWDSVRICLHETGPCKHMKRAVRNPNTGAVEEESQDMFYARHLSPIESGCCAPPSTCGFDYNNETLWTPKPGAPLSSNEDCHNWTNDQDNYCFECSSCKAGVLAANQKTFRKVGTLILVASFVVIAVNVPSHSMFVNAVK